MKKYLQDKEIDLLIPDSKISKTAFLPAKHSYKLDQVVTLQEIKDSQIIKDSLFQFTSVCKTSVENAQIITTLPDNSMYTYQVSDQKSILELIIAEIEKSTDTDVNKASMKVIQNLYEVFGIKDDLARQQAMFVQISHLVTPGNLDFERYLKFLKGKLKHVQLVIQHYPQILF